MPIPIGTKVSITSTINDVIVDSRRMVGNLIFYTLKDNGDCWEDDLFDIIELPKKE